MDYDLITITDGSATTLDKAAGWTSVLLFGNEIKILTGCVSKGTNNYAELAPIVHALYYYENKLATVKRSLQSKRIKILIVSDSQLTIKQGRGEYARNANGFLWASIDYFASLGYDISWKWVPRNSNPVNTYCDATAGDMRKMIAKHMTEEMRKDPKKKDIEELVKGFEERCM